MNTQLITYTAQPLATVARAAWICTHAEWPTPEQLHPDTAAPLVRRVLASGHLSVLEHVNFTFAIDGISRVCSHQLVRHRLASYSQQSQRYVTADQPDYITPASLASNPQLVQSLAEDYQGTMDALWKIYQKLIEDGVPAEDARFVLPNAAATKIVLTMNARQLHHFFSLRTCTRAQWEIREIALDMLLKVKNVAPVLFENCGPGCLRGHCPEGDKSCQRRFNKKTEMAKL